MKNDKDSKSAVIPVPSTTLAQRRVQVLARRGLGDLDLVSEKGKDSQTADVAQFSDSKLVKLPRVIPHLWTGPDDVAHGYPPGCSFCGESDPAQYGKPCPKRSCSTWYEVLGIPESADENQIATAYHELAEKWNPDRLQTTDDILFDAGHSETQMKWFNAAYAVLNDPITRQQYDAELHGRRENR